MLLFIVLILGGVLLGAYIVTDTITKYTGYVVQEMSLDDFAKCLSNKNVIMYGMPRCYECENQKRIFQESWQYVNYVSCDPKVEDLNGECIKIGIAKYPTWQINNQLYLGEINFENLSELSGCKLA